MAIQNDRQHRRVAAHTARAAVIVGRADSGEIQITEIVAMVTGSNKREVKVSEV